MIWMISIVIYVPLIVLGLWLFTGHGSNLIAGYNTMTEEQRKTVNVKALGRAVGSYVIFIALICLVCTLAVEWAMSWLTWTLIALMIVSIVPFLIYINKSSRFKSEEQQ